MGVEKGHTILTCCELCFVSGWVIKWIPRDSLISNWNDHSQTGQEGCDEADEAEREAQKMGGVEAGNDTGLPH